MTCAQIAIIPRNSASEVSAAASTATARTMTKSSRREQDANIVRYMFSSQEETWGLAQIYPFGNFRFLASASRWSRRASTPAILAASSDL